MINTNHMKLKLAAEIQRDFKIARIKRKVLEASQFLAVFTLYIAILILVASI
jgi:hypothetical protein